MSLNHETLRNFETLEILPLVRLNSLPYLFSKTLLETQKSEKLRLHMFPETKIEHVRFLSDNNEFYFFFSEM